MKDVSSPGGGAAAGSADRPASASGSEGARAAAAVASARCRQMCAHPNENFIARSSDCNEVGVISYCLSLL